MSTSSNSSNIPWPEPASQRRSSRGRFSLKSTRSLFFLVLLIAGILGGWAEAKRRYAVRQLIGQLSGCRSDIVIPSVAAGTFGPTIRRIRELHGEPFAVDSVIRVLHGAHETHDYATAEAAIACLLQMEPESIRAVPELVAMIADEDLPNQPAQRWYWKQYAIGAIGRLGRDDETRTVVPALRQVLDDPLKSRIDLIAEDTIEALGNIGALAVPAVPDLTRWLSHANPKIRLAAVVALGRIGVAAESATSGVLGALKDPDERVRVQSILSLAAMAPEHQRTTEIIAAVEEVAHYDPELRAVCEQSLSRLRRKHQVAVNIDRMLPHLSPEARQRYLEKMASENAKESRRSFR